MSRPPEGPPFLTVFPLDDDGRVRLVGELDISTVEILHMALGTVADHAPVTFDLAGLSFMDVAGLHAFEHFARTRDGAGPVVLENVSAHIRRVFEISGADRNPDIELRMDGDRV